MNASLTDKQARSKQELNDVKKADYAVVEEFWQGFSKSFRKAFDQRYCEHLREDVFQYKGITPRMFTEHLKNKWVKLNTIVIKRHQEKYLCGWDAEDKHTVLFQVHLDREQKTYLE